MCIDFWSAEDSSNKSLDVLVVSDHYTKLAQAYLCPNQSAKAVNSFGTTFSASTAFRSECTLIRVQILRAVL